MTFDEQLRHAFDSLSERVRDEVTRQLQSVKDDIAATAASERAAAVAQAVAEARVEAERAADFARAEAERAVEARLLGLVREAEAASHAAGLHHGLERGREEGLRQGREDGRREGREEGLREGRDEGYREGREEGVRQGREEGLHEGRDEGRRSADVASGERLVDAVRAIDRAKSLSEVLDTLAGCAAREAARAAVLVVEGEKVRGWRFLGFGPAMEQAAQVQCAMSEAGIVHDAIQAGTTIIASSGNGSLPRFASLPPGRGLIAVPIPVGGQVVAVLYADRGEADHDANPGTNTWSTTLEVLARHAARSLEAVTALRAAQALTGNPALRGQAS